VSETIVRRLLILHQKTDLFSAADTGAGSENSPATDHNQQPQQLELLGGLDAFATGRFRRVLRGESC